MCTDKFTPHESLISHHSLISYPAFTTHLDPRVAVSFYDVPLDAPARAAVGVHAVVRGEDFVGAHGRLAAAEDDAPAKGGTKRKRRWFGKLSLVPSLHPLYISIYHNTRARLVSLKIWVFTRLAYHEHGRRVLGKGGETDFAYAIFTYPINVLHICILYWSMGPKTKFAPPQSTYVTVPNIELWGKLSSKTFRVDV